jgi:rare lipoprotein A
MTSQWSICRLQNAQLVDELARLLQQQSKGAHRVKMRTRLNAAAILTFFFGTAAASSVAHAQTGLASIYKGGRTANGEMAYGGGLTAAHRTLPFGTLVRVTNRHTGRNVVVRINDRGPFVRGRIIDLMPAAARAIGCSGLAHVTVDVIGRRHGRRSV